MRVRARVRVRVYERARVCACLSVRVRELRRLPRGLPGASPGLAAASLSVPIKLLLRNQRFPAPAPPRGFLVPWRRGPRRTY